MNKLLLIGGTDPSGAGLQTDWKVVNALEVHTVSVVTSVTAQSNTRVINNGVLPYAQLKAQFDALKNETFVAIKIGMLGNEGAVKAVVNFLEKQVQETAVILDPVLSASSGDALLNYAGQRLLLKKLLPHVTLLTPNLQEIARLTNLPCSTDSECHIATQALFDLGVKSVLVKGGHQTPGSDTQESTDSTDIFISPSGSFYLMGKRWQNRSNVRGTGCVFATAVAANIAQGYPLVDALVLAKALVSQGIKHALDNNNNTFRFHFTRQYSGKNFSLQHLPKLLHHPQQQPESQNTPFNFSPCDTKKLGIYPVVDSVEWIKKLVPLGIKTIQLRIKDKQDDEVENEIKEAITFCRKTSIRLFINDYWRIAVKHRAYGIHLGQEDLADADLQAIADAGCRLGISTHSYAEVARTIAIKPSYIALGPIFETTSKVMPWIPQGIAAVENWVKLLGDDYPLVAIGGINYERAKALKKTGVGSVAMISAITEAADYKKITRSLVELY